MIRFHRLHSFRALAGLSMVVGLVPACLTRSLSDVKSKPRSLDRTLEEQKGFEVAREFRNAFDRYKLAAISPDTTADPDLFAQVGLNIARLPDRELALILSDREFESTVAELVRPAKKSLALTNPIAIDGSNLQESIPLGAGAALGVVAIATLTKGVWQSYESWKAAVGVKAEVEATVSALNAEANAVDPAMRALAAEGFAFNQLIDTGVRTYLGESLSLRDIMNLVDLRTKLYANDGPGIQPKNLSWTLDEIKNKGIKDRLKKLLQGADTATIASRLKQDPLFPAKLIGDDILVEREAGALLRRDADLALRTGDTMNRPHEIPGEIEAAKAAGDAKLKDLEPVRTRTVRLLFTSVAFATLSAALIGTSQLKLAVPQQERRHKAELALSVLLRDLGALESKLQSR